MNDTIRLCLIAMIMRKHTIQPKPKIGTIVDVTLKKQPRKPEKRNTFCSRYGEIYTMDGGKISGIYVETLDNWQKIHKT